MSYKGLRGTTMRHLTEEEIDKLLANRLQHDDQEKVIRHLLAGCGLCSRQVVEQAPGLLLERAVEDRHRTAPSSPSERALAAATEREARWRMEEEKLNRSLELLRTSPQIHDAPMLRQRPGLRGAPLVKALLHRSFELRFTDLKAMRALAYTAVRTAESLESDGRSPGALADLQAAAWADLGNAYRLHDEFAEAEAAFRKARAQLRRGTGDLLLLARVADLEASLRNAQRRFSEACKLLDKVYRLYLQIGDRHLAGRALLSKSVNIHYGETPSEALPFIRQSLSLLDPERDPQLFAIGQQGLLDTLVDCGELREAGRLVLTGGLRQSFGAESTPLLKLRISEGKMLAGLGNLSSAERVLTMAREGFLQRDQHYEAALVGLDLLPVLIQRGSYGKAGSTARELYAILLDLGIYHEAAKARRYLQ